MQASGREWRVLTPIQNEVKVSRWRICEGRRGGGCLLVGCGVRGSGGREDGEREREREKVESRGRGGEVRMGGLRAGWRGQVR